MLRRGGEFRRRRGAAGRSATWDRNRVELESRRVREAGVVCSLTITPTSRTSYALHREDDVISVDDGPLVTADTLTIGTKATRSGLSFNVVENAKTRMRLLFPPPTPTQPGDAVDLIVFSNHNLNDVLQ